MTKGAPVDASASERARLALAGRLYERFRSSADGGDTWADLVTGASEGSVPDQVIRDVWLAVADEAAAAFREEALVLSSLGRRFDQIVLPAEEALVVGPPYPETLTLSLPDGTEVLRIETIDVADGALPVLAAYVEGQRVAPVRVGEAIGRWTRAWEPRPLVPVPDSRTASLVNEEGREALVLFWPDGAEAIALEARPGSAPPAAVGEVLLAWRKAWREHEVADAGEPTVAERLRSAWAAQDPNAVRSQLSGELFASLAGTVECGTCGCTGTCRYRLHGEVDESAQPCATCGCMWCGPMRPAIRENLSAQGFAGRAR